jgi:hypothetical protein
MKKLQLGVNTDISNHDYHADNTFLSSTQLKKILDDPKQFNDELLGQGKIAAGDYLENHPDVMDAIKDNLYSVLNSTPKVDIGDDVVEEEGEEYE